jgi:hypothetical protein
MGVVAQKMTDSFFECVRKRIRGALTWPPFFSRRRLRHSNDPGPSLVRGDVKTTMIYTHALNNAGGRGVGSSLENL